MNPTRTAAHPLEATRTRRTRRVERHFHFAGHGYTFDYGFLAEDFEPGQLSESHGCYRLPVEIQDRDPFSDRVATWVLTIPAKILAPRRHARLRPLAEVLFVAHLFYSDNDPFDDDDVYGVPVDCDGLRAQVVRFAVVTAGRRARTRYVRHWMLD